MNSTDCIAARLERMQHEFRERVNEVRNGGRGDARRHSDQHAIRALRAANLA